MRRSLNPKKYKREYFALRDSKLKRSKVKDSKELYYYYVTVGPYEVFRTYNQLGAAVLSMNSNLEIEQCEFPDEGLLVVGTKDELYKFIKKYCNSDQIDQIVRYRDGCNLSDESSIKDSKLNPFEKNIFAKRILNVNSDKELLDIIYELINYDGKLFDRAMDIYEGEGSISYRVKKISDLLLNTSIKDAGWYSIEHITVGSANDITLKNIVKAVKKVARTEVKKIMNGTLENNTLTLQVYAKNDMNKKFTWMEVPLDFDLDVKEYYKGNEFDSIAYYKSMSAIKTKLKTYTNKTLYEDKSIKDGWSIATESKVIRRFDKENVPYELGCEGGFQFKNWEDLKMAEEIIRKIVRKNYWIDKSGLIIYLK